MTKDNIDKLSSNS